MLLQRIMLSEGLPATMHTAREILPTLMCSKVSPESSSCYKAFAAPSVLAHVVPDI